MFIKLHRLSYAAGVSGGKRSSTTILRFTIELNVASLGHQADGVVVVAQRAQAVPMNPIDRERFFCERGGGQACRAPIGRPLGGANPSYTLSF